MIADGAVVDPTQPVRLRPLTRDIEIDYTALSLAEPRKVRFLYKLETYKVDTLVVDLFDAKTEKLIWRSSSSDTLSDKADKNTKNLDKGVNKMFQHFPPPNRPNTKESGMNRCLAFFTRYLNDPEHAGHSPARGKQAARES